MRPLAKLMTAHLWTLGLVAALAAPAAAQEAAGGFETGRPRPIELSIGGAGVVSWISPGGGIRAMVMMPIGERVSLDVFGGPYYAIDRSDFGGEDILAFYGAQVTRRIDRGRRLGVEPFLSFGAEGLVYRDQVYDASCYLPGCARHTVTRATPPVILMAGFGFQKTLSPRFAIRVEVQGLVALVVPAGVRLGISLTMPIGRVYETVPRAR